MARQSLVSIRRTVAPRSSRWLMANSCIGCAMIHCYFDAAAFLRASPAARPQAVGIGRTRRWMTSILGPCWTACPIHRKRSTRNTKTRLVCWSPAHVRHTKPNTSTANSRFNARIRWRISVAFIRRSGLTISDQHPDRPDHVVLELEFMAHLLGLERQAADEDSDRRAEHLQVCRDAQARFLGEHLAWWTPAFAKLLGCANPAWLLRGGWRFSGRLDSGRAGLAPGCPQHHVPSGPAWWKDQNSARVVSLSIDARGSRATFGPQQSSS